MANSVGMIKKKGNISQTVIKLSLEAPKHKRQPDCLVLDKWSIYNLYKSKAD